MTRTEDDTWDLASSVGMTATMVAAARALATRDDRRLIDDPFAEPLVRAVGIGFFTDLLDGRIDASALGDSGPERLRAMVAGMAMRTRFFDDHFTRAGEAGITQAVILASGLDSRAYRLAWPPRAVVYEVDRPVEFKAATLAGLGARPTAQVRTVGLDLRGDWPGALQDVGFDPALPTAWLAEGLLIYLPPEAQDRLMETITALSAPGSAVATEYVPGIVDFDAARARELTANLRERGLQLDMASLIYPGPRTNVVDHLGALGWRVTGTPDAELFAGAGVAAPERGDDDPLGEIVYVRATR